MQKRKTFSREFRLEAVHLLDQGDKSAAELARELGIKRNQLCKWKEQLTEMEVSSGLYLNSAPVVVKR